MPHDLQDPNQVKFLDWVRATYGEATSSACQRIWINERKQVDTLEEALDLALAEVTRPQMEALAALDALPLHGQLFDSRVDPAIDSIQH